MPPLAMRIVVGSHGDGIVDAGFLHVLLDIGGVIVIDIEADDLQTAFEAFCRLDEIGHFGAARSAPSGPEIQQDNFAVEGVERDGLAIERGQFEIGRRIGIADEADDGLVVLVCGRQRRARARSS